MIIKLPAALVAILLVATILPARADSSGRKAAEFASGSGNIIYLAAAVGLPLLTDGSHGKNHSVRALDAIGVASEISEVLKVLVKEKRPDSDSHDSFPSGHATAAFAAATMKSAFHPRQAWAWYTGASLISLSRIRLNRHTPTDVAVGGLLGFGVARWELSQEHGLALQPWINRDEPGITIVTSRSF